MSCAHRRGFSLPWAHCHSCAGTGTQPWVLPYKMGYCNEAICSGYQNVVVLVLSLTQTRWNHWRWQQRVFLVDAFSFWLCLFCGCNGQWKRSLDCSYLPICRVLVSLVVLYVPIFGVNAPVELLGDAWCSPWAVGITRLFLFSAAWLCHCYDLPWLLLTELLPLLDHEGKGRVFDFGFKR